MDAPTTNPPIFYSNFATLLAFARANSSLTITHHLTNINVITIGSWQIEVQLLNLGQMGIRQLGPGQSEPGQLGPTVRPEKVTGNMMSYHLDKKRKVYEL